MSGGGGSGFEKVLGGSVGSVAGSALMGPAGAVLGAWGGSKFNPKGVLDGLNPKVNVPSAMPRPEWNLTGPDGKLRPDLMLGSELPQAATQSQDVLNKLVGTATAQGPSDQAKYLQDANKRLMNNSLDQAEALGKGNLAGMTSNLAMRGGLDSGARERLNKGSGFETMMNKQRIMNDAAGANLDILAKDESSKLDTLKALPASLLAQAGFQQGNKQFDIQNTLNTVGNKYSTDMQAWGANQAAREQAQLANKKSGIFGLGIGGIL
jgi:hypothetical protein